MLRSIGPVMPSAMQPVRSRYAMFLVRAVKAGLWSKSLCISLSCLGMISRNSRIFSMAPDGRSWITPPGRM